MMRMPFLEKHLLPLLRFHHRRIFGRKLAREGKNLKRKRPAPFGSGPSLIGVAVTYFRMRMHTIIGANPFHGPVRDGKAWFQVAIAAT